ncbi:hypothetical protein MMC30_001608 [Trapelia coarctata]|nr:hypothetical protein [Trapelia coarctata]
MVEVHTSPLLGLPGELRKMIYKRVLCPADGVNLVLKEPKDFQIINEVPSLGDSKPPRQLGPSLRVAGKPRMARTLEVLQRINHIETVNHLKSTDVSSAFLRVCKLFYEEAVPLLYSENTFCVYAELLPFLYGLLAAVGSINAASIRFLHIYYFRAPLVDLSYELMIPRNPLMKLCHQFPDLQELKVWRPQEDIDDEFRGQNAGNFDKNSTIQFSREMASRVLILALHGVKSLKSVGSESGNILVGKEQRYVRWVKGEKELQITTGVSVCASGAAP